MTTPTTPIDAMLPLPLAEVLVITSDTSHRYFKAAQYYYSKDQLQAHAAQRCAELEKRVAELDVTVLQVATPYFQIKEQQ